MDPTSVSVFVISTSGRGLELRIAGPKTEHGPIVIDSWCE